MRGSQIIDVSMIPGDKTSGSLTPIVGIEGGVHIDYDRKTQTMFWVEGKDDAGKDDDDKDDRENVSTFLSVRHINYVPRSLFALRDEMIGFVPVHNLDYTIWWRKQD